MQRRNVFLGALTLLLLSVVLSGCLSIFGPKEAEVTGQVTYVDGTPVAGATVKLGTLTTTTGANGAFKFSQKVKHDTYGLTVTLEGEEVHKRQVKVTGATLNISIELPLDHCYPGNNAPEGMTMVLCIDGREGASIEEIGFTPNAGDWGVVELSGRKWLQVNAAASIQHAAIEIPEMATADKVVVEFTGMYTSAGNTWGLAFADNAADKPHENAYLILSAWDAIYLRPYRDGQAVDLQNATYKHAPKIESNTPVTVRVEYDRTAHTLRMWRNGSLVTTNPVIPSPLPENQRMDGPEAQYLKLYANAGGQAGPTTALWTDIRVWVQ